MLIVELIFERYTTIPCQEKNPDQKILFFHGEIQFSKCEIWAEYLEICQVVILFRRGLHMTKTRVFSFGTFLELEWHLQSTRSRRLVNGFWWFLMQNKAESLFVFFPLFPTHFCWVENNENFQWNKKLRFVLVLEFNVVVGMGLKMTKILHLHHFCWLKTKV